MSGDGARGDTHRSSWKPERGVVRLMSPSSVMGAVDPLTSSPKIFKPCYRLRPRIRNTYQSLNAGRIQWLITNRIQASPARSGGLRVRKFAQRPKYRA